MSAATEFADASVSVVSDDEVERYAGVADESSGSPRRWRWMTWTLVALLVASLVLVIALGITVTGWAWSLIVVPIASLLFFFAPRRLAESPIADALPLSPAAVVTRRWMNERQQIADHAAHFCDFLDEAGVPGASVPSKPLDRIPPADSDIVLVNALVEVAKAAIGRGLPSSLASSADACQRYAVLAAGEFLVQFVPRRRPAITELATRGHEGRDPFANVMLAYREMSGSLPAGTEPYVALGRMVAAGQSMPVAPDRRALGNVKNSLSAGSWPEKYSDLLETGIEQAAQEHAKVAKIATNPFVDHSLRRLLENVSLHTFEHFLETQAMVGYIVNFDGTGGPLADVLMKMKTRVDETGALRYEVKGQPKYNFDLYYANTRIGVVPRSLTFEEFSRQFKSDFLAEYDLAKKRGEVFRSTDVALQRLRLGQSFTVIEETGHAVTHLRAVVADVFTPEERAALLGYDGEVTTINLLDGVLALTLRDAAEGVDGLTGHGKALEDVDQTVRDRLLTWSGRNRGQLSIKCAEDPVYADTARDELTRSILVTEQSRMPLGVAEAIADNYIGALVTVGGVYGAP